MCDDFTVNHCRLTPPLATGASAILLRVMHDRLLLVTRVGRVHVWFDTVVYTSNILTFTEGTSRACRVS